jgi:predicted transcriptional regulator
MEKEGRAMSAQTVPISEVSHQALQELARQTSQPVEAILDRAIEDYRRKVFFETLNAGYAALRADPQAWAEELEERKVGDATLMDGLDPDERWTEDGRVIAPEEREK